MLENLEMRISVKEKWIELEEESIKVDTKSSILFLILGVLTIILAIAISIDMNIINTISMCVLVNLTMTEINKLLIEIPSRKRYLRTEKIGLKCLKYDQKLNKKLE